jgi:hypothetical protein
MLEDPPIDAKISLVHCISRNTLHTSLEPLVVAGVLPEDVSAAVKQSGIQLRDECPGVKV